jgi:hypothetical protein
MKNPKIILISGKAGSGKDTFANILKEEAKGKTLILHYADLLKYICKTYFGWNGEKDDYGRALLQKVGTDIVKSKKPTFWVDFIIDMVSFFDNEYDYFFVADCRFVEEITTFKNTSYDVFSVRIQRDGNILGLTQEQLNHRSETALDNFDFDFIIENNGSLNDLRIKAKNLLLALDK